MQHPPRGSDGGPVRVLIVEDDEGFADLLATQLSRPGAIEALVAHAPDLTDALRELDQATFDLVVLDLGLPDGHGLSVVKRIVDASHDSAVVVVTADEDPQMAVQSVALGAQEYVLKREITPPLLDRTIRYALDRQRLSQELAEALQRERAERELRRLERMAEGAPASVTADLFGQGSLSSRSPERWQELRLEYRRLLDLAIEERTHRRTPQVSPDLRSLAGVIGFLGAGPRDVVALHSTVVSEVIRNSTSRLAEAYAEEGRILVLELMGYLTSYYRSRATVIHGASAGEGR